MSLFPVTVYTTPFACWMGKSKRGEVTAARAASCARFFPLPLPIPINAKPAFCMTDRTSAKSTLINPGLVIISDMPTIPCRRILSARINASCNGKSEGATSKSLSLDTTMRISTCLRSSSIAATACCIRICPSNPKGLVTIPTVRLPALLATSAMTGVAPEPVPPPIPAVTNTISVLLSADSIALTLSTAADRPMAGFAPAPRPRVVPGPIWIRFGALDLHNAWTSVLTAQNSTLASSSSIDSIMRLTVFPPPPPTPTTLMLHGALAVSEGTETVPKLSEFTLSLSSLVLPIGAHVRDGSLAPILRRPGSALRRVWRWAARCVWSCGAAVPRGPGACLVTPLATYAAATRNEKSSAVSAAGRAGAARCICEARTCVCSAVRAGVRV
mmetsp:Transcript_7348/g.17922  ORF Transcript_7348/g.17922 Transcript_7348/m.17922 type:complete len:386 (+) Transcript_7348:614-1771(+)